ncbi:hypothetical protein [Rhodopseudomonas sp. BR0G17]|nr:hypothetical protein [Rhodopseudomonas sp. BR0G17]
MRARRDVDERDGGDEKRGVIITSQIDVGADGRVPTQKRRPELGGV